MSVREGDRQDSNLKYIQDAEIETNEENAPFTRDIESKRKFNVLSR